MLVLICDGSSLGNPGPAKIGVVGWKRDNNPRRVIPNIKISREIGVATNIEAEWEAIIEATKTADFHQKKGEDIYIFNDSQVVVKQANCVWGIKDPKIAEKFSKYVYYRSLVPRMQLLWVPRQLVYLADKAARQGENS